MHHIYGNVITYGCCQIFDMIRGDTLCNGYGFELMVDVMVYGLACTLN
jgi:hypothetical protein